MSHLSTVTLVVRDLEALAEASAEHGLELRRGQTTHRWYGRSVGDYRDADAVQNHGLRPDGRCAHAIGIPGDAGAYEIGVVKNPEGEGYRLVWDTWQGGRGLVAKVRDPATQGDNMNKLLRSYTVATLRREATRQRKRVRTEALPDGRVRMLVTV